MLPEGGAGLGHGRVYFETMRTGKLLDPVDEVGADADEVAGLLDLGDPRQQRLEQDPHLEPGQVGAHAGVGALAESHVVVGHPVEPQRVGVLEPGLVAVARGPPHDDLVALLDLLPVQLDVAGRRTTEVVDRRGEAQELLDRDLRLVGVARRSHCIWSGLSISAFIEWLIAWRVVSLPATTSSRK